MNNEQLNAARKNLSNVIIKIAHNISKSLNIGFEESNNAPNTFKQLKEHYKNIKNSGGTFKVYSGGCDTTIYTSLHANYAFRFWHDITHLTYDLGFSTNDEIETAKKQMEVLKKYIPADSLEFKLFYADTIGQTEYYADHKDFVKDQMAYVVDYVKTKLI